jgi:hypothetical protein
MTTTTTTLTTAADLAHQFHAEGFAPGVPYGLPAEALAIDLACYSRQRCPCCRKRLGVRPWTDGARYRLLCSCRCGFGAEG